MSFSDWLLGLDVGTSFCVAAHRDGAGRAEVIEIGGQRRVPSVIVVDDQGRVVVGHAATGLALANPSHALRSPKSRIGDPSPIILGGRRYDVVDLVAGLLHHLYAAAVAQHGGHGPAQVRLTHPAGWGRVRVGHLRAAAERAGLPGPVMVVEPVAAAWAHAADEAVPDGSHLAVYDLGGGTFDTAVVQACSGGFTVVGRPVGEDRLGGELFDELLANHVGERLNPQQWEALQLSDALRWQQSAAALRIEARRAKEALSSHEYAELLVALPEGLVQQRVTRQDLEALMDPYIQQSVDRLGQVVADAGLRPEQLRAICLTGGASHAPLVERAVRAAFPGVPIRRRGDPKAAVAIGAAALPDNFGRGSVAAGDAAQKPAARGLGQPRPWAPPAVPATAASAGATATVVVAARPGLEAQGVPAALPRRRTGRRARTSSTSDLTANSGTAAAEGALSGRNGAPRLAWYGVSGVAVIAIIVGIALLAQTGSRSSGLHTVSSVDPTDPVTSATTTTTLRAATGSTAVPVPLPSLSADSPVEQFLGTEIRRHWSVDADRNVVTVSVTVTNVAAGSFRWHHDEPVPVSLGSDAGGVSTNPPAEIMGPGVLLRWWYELAPRQSKTFTYTASRQPTWPARASIDVGVWEAERALATASRQVEILSTNQLTDRTAAPVPVAIAAGLPSTSGTAPSGATANAPGGSVGAVTDAGSTGATSGSPETGPTTTVAVITTTVVPTATTPTQPDGTPPSGPPSPPQPPPNAAPVLNCDSAYTVNFNSFSVEYYYKVASNCFSDPDSGVIPQAFTSPPSVGSVVAGCAGRFSTEDWCWTYTPFAGWDGTPYQIDVLLFARDEQGAESPSITLTLCFNCP